MEQAYIWDMEFSMANSGFKYGGKKLAGLIALPRYHTIQETQFELAASSIEQGNTPKRS